MVDDLNARITSLAEEARSSASDPERPRGAE